MRLTIGELVLELTEAQEAEVREQLGESKSRTHPGFEQPESMLDVAEVAERLRVSRDYVYAHARDLGGEKLGTSPKAPWRFNPNTLGPGTRSDSSGSSDPKLSEPRRRQRKAGGGATLLAVRGAAPYAASNEKRPPGGVRAPAGGLDTGGGCSNARD